MNEPTATRPGKTWKSTFYFWIWLVAAQLSLTALAVICTAWATKQALLQGPRLSQFQAKAILEIANFPSLIRPSIRELKARLKGTQVTPFLIDRKDVEQPNWVRRFPAPDDPGYLLFSGPDPTAKSAIVQLIRIADGERIARWEPDWSAIFAQMTPKKFASVHQKAEIHAPFPRHPILLSDGDIIFNNSTSLVRLGPCSPKPVWVLDDLVHHSNELDSKGTVWVPSILPDAFPNNRELNKVQDNALGQVSTDGKIISKRSFVHILLDNGLRAMLLAGMDPIHVNTINGEVFSDDLIHINQISVASQDSKHWMQGDLLVSARNLNTIFLYRPSTNRIIWYKTGPWMNQHSALFIDDHRISVFDNNVVSGLAKEYAFVNPGETNRVLLYDFDSDQISQPFAALLAKARPITLSEGRAQLLPDGGLFVEETDNGRILRFTRDRLMWSRVNDYDHEHIGVMGWSRYLTADEARVPLNALASKNCQVSAPPIRLGN